MEVIFQIFLGVYIAQLVFVWAMQVIAPQPIFTFKEFVLLNIPLGPVFYVFKRTHEESRKNKDRGY